MDEKFDIDAAVDEIGAGLGLEEPTRALGDGTGTDKSDLVLEPAATVTTIAEPAASTTSTETPPAEVTDTTTTTGDQVQVAADNAAPRTWRAEAAASWATLPPIAQQEILKREQDIWKGLEVYKADAAYGKGFKQVIQPYEGILKEHGIEPVAQVTNLMKAHFTLATGTAEQKLELFQKLAADYDIDLINAATAIPPFIDPQVTALQKQVELLQSTQTAQQTALATEARAKIESEIDTFAVDKGNIYFEELVDDVAKLLNSGQARSLKEAYETAIWMNPTVRAKELTRQQANKDSEALKQRQAQTANARKALGANVKASAKSGSAAAPLGSIDDTLNEALTAIRGRA